MPSRHYGLKTCNHGEKCLFSFLSTKTAIVPIKMLPGENMGESVTWSVKTKPGSREGELNGTLKLTRYCNQNKGCTSNKADDLE